MNGFNKAGGKREQFDNGKFRKNLVISISESKLYPLYSTPGDYWDYFGVVTAVVL